MSAKNGGIMAKITDKEIKACVDTRMRIKDIGEKFGVSPVTALNRVREYKRQITRSGNPKEIDKNLYGKTQTNFPFLPDDESNNPDLRLLPSRVTFNLVVGDLVWAVDSETKNGKELYEVIAMSICVYTIRRTSGFGKVMSCQKSTYGKESDPNKVELARHKKKGG